MSFPGSTENYARLVSNGSDKAIEIHLGVFTENKQRIELLLWSVLRAASKAEMEVSLMTEEEVTKALGKRGNLTEIHPINQHECAETQHND